MLNFTAENTSKRNMNDILIENTLDRLCSEELAQHFSHVVCNGGQCDFCFNEKPFTLHSGDSMVIVANRLVSDIRPSADFQVRVVYVSPQFLEATRPTNNYQVPETNSARNSQKRKRRRKKTNSQQPRKWSATASFPSKTPSPTSGIPKNKSLRNSAANRHKSNAFIRTVPERGPFFHCKKAEEMRTTRRLACWRRLVYI